MVSCVTPFVEHKCYFSSSCILSEHSTYFISLVLGQDMLAWHPSFTYSLIHLSYLFILLQNGVQVCLLSGTSLYIVIWVNVCSTPHKFKFTSALSKVQRSLSCPILQLSQQCWNHSLRYSNRDLQQR